MKKLTPLSLLILLLVAINLGLCYLYFFKPNHSRKKGNDSMHSWLDKNVGMTAQQESLHVKLRTTYFSDLRAINDSIRVIKARFISRSAENDFSDSLSTYWTDSINRWQRRADELTFRHVRAVRNILEPKQQPILDSLIQVLMLRKNKE